MTTLLTILAGIALFGVLAFTGAKLWIWSAAFLAFFVGGNLVGAIGSTGLIIALAILLPVSVLFNVVALRRAVITKPIFKGFKAVLPDMTSTEREALEAGDVWWEAEMFRGKPEWSKLMNFKQTQLTAEEQSFLDNETEELCRMLDEWQIFQDKALPEPVMNYMREKRFFAMLISKEWGGLGFSAYAQSCVVTKIATRSIVGAVTVMVPNSLGPGELLMHYGTDAQKKEYLPKLADGSLIPAFGLTGPEAGSDAGAIPDTAVVCKGTYQGEETIGLKLNFSKRWITLAPISDVVGLAVKLYDPDGLLGDASKVEYGITCVLLPSTYPGIEIGRRHRPAETPFMNGPINGKDVFVPLDFIIGGKDKAGGGWRMLVECLSAGRGISLPALSAAAGQMAYRMTGAFGRIRRQFKTAIGSFEGVQEASARIGGYTYKLEAMRQLTASAVDVCSPSVVTAMAKYHMTQMMRTIMTDAMDIHGGRGVMDGPRNYLGAGFRSIPIAITVEGANILTRNLMIFGQGAIRCHPYVFPEMEAAREDNLVEFDRLLWSHVGFSVNRGMRAFVLGLTGGRLASSPVDDRTAPYFRQLERMSSALAFTSDVTMGVLGGELKRKERLSARLGDVLSQLYMASATLKYFHDNGARDEDWPYAQWVLDDALFEINKAFDEFYANFPIKPIAALLRFVAFPRGRSYQAVGDELGFAVADHLMQPSALRDRLTSLCHLSTDPNDAIGRMENTFNHLVKVEPLYLKFAKAVAKGAAPMKFTVEEQLEACVEQGLLTRDEADQVAEYDALRRDAILTDAFDKQWQEVTPAWTPEMADDAPTDTRAAA